MKLTRTTSTRRLGLSTLLVTTLAISIAGGAFADSPKERKEDRKEDRKDRKEDLKDRKEDRKEDRVEFKKEWKEKHSAWVEKRSERRDARREEVKKRWGNLVEKPAGRAELRKHARRVARLERIIFVADATEKPKVSENAKALLEKERTRHQARMEALKSLPVVNQPAAPAKQ